MFNNFQREELNIRYIVANIAKSPNDDFSWL